ncbi:hypothetical protein GCM10023224_28080 [Streptomonospora halophila]|uniref:Uncharacterized protein n=1 Tax=Streptomonospora halophila TaxID=427369 RepID=A0ABP9GI94_9ACTN
MTTDAEAASSAGTALPPLATAVGGGLLVGCLTSYGQGLLPSALAPLANSAGSWSLIAFLLAMRGPRPWLCMLAASLSLAAMVLGYDLASVLRGYAASPVATAFWLTAAVVVGPVLGWGAATVRRRSGLAPAAIGAMSGVLVGEGVYGLLYIADTTSPLYWSGSVAAGTALLAWACVRRFPDPRSILLGTAATALTAAAFVGVYSSNVLVLFSRIL